MKQKSKTLNHAYIIPARAGSKRLPNKNRRLLWGQPLFAHTVASALGCSVDDQMHPTGIKTVCVSSDDPEILSVSANIPGVVALERPDELAGDEVSTQRVLRHAVECLEADIGMSYDIIWWMNACVPQVTSEDLIEGYQMFSRNDLREVTTVNSDGIAYSGVRLMKRSALFSGELSTHLGVIHRDYIDVHTEEDLSNLARVERRGSP